MGCVAEKEKEDLFKRGVSFVIGTRALNKIPEAVRNSQEGRKQIFLDDTLDEIEYEHVETRASSHHAWVTIIYGCNRFCTYCIVPYTRGREKSRVIDEVLTEVNNLADRGYKEFTFFKTECDAYGKDLADGTSLAKLLFEASKIENVERLWFLTSYPSDFSLEIPQVMATSDKCLQNLYTCPFNMAAIRF